MADEKECKESITGRLAFYLPLGISNDDVIVLEMDALLPIEESKYDLSL